MAIKKKPVQNRTCKTGLPLLLALVLLIVLPPWSRAPGQTSPTVKKIYSGNRIKLSDGRRIVYAGLSVPDKKSKPFFALCRRANRELVYKKAVIVRPDMSLKEESDSRIPAYVFVGDDFVNAELIRRGYALAIPNQHGNPYSELFVSLQQQAREQRRGLWAYEGSGSEPYYIGSKSRKDFHRPRCFHTKSISFDDRVIFRTRDEALQKGFVQDWRCCPLFDVPGK